MKIKFQDSVQAVSVEHDIVERLAENFIEAIHDAYRRRVYPSDETIWNMIRTKVPQNIQWDVLKLVLPDYYKHLFKKVTGERISVEKDINNTFELW